MKNTDTNAGAPLKNQVSDLYELMRTEKLEELEIKDDNFFLHIKRKGRRAAAPAAPAAPATAYEAAPAAPETAPAEIAGETVKSPIMGVLYRSPSPSSPPFVKEGDVVNPGKTLCIVEAMKVMNEIKADSRMRIIKILVENGKPITNGQDLFLIEKV